MNIKILDHKIMVHWYIIARRIFTKSYYALVHDVVILSFFSFWFSIVVPMLLQDSVWQCWLLCEQDIVDSHIDFLCQNIRRQFISG